MEKYLIVGTGGVGGSIAGFLALAGKDVTCIARGKHLEAIREKGLHLRSDLKGNHFLPVQACTAEEGDELNASLHNYVCAGWQRESLSCPIYHLHHWYLQREVVTFYYFFHKLI